MLLHTRAHARARCPPPPLLYIPCEPERGNPVRPKLDHKWPTTTCSGRACSDNLGWDMGSDTGITTLGSIRWSTVHTMVNMVVGVQRAHSLGAGQATTPSPRRCPHRSRPERGASASSSGWSGAHPTSRLNASILAKRKSHRERKKGHGQPSSDSACSCLHVISLRMLIVAGSPPGRALCPIWRIVTHINCREMAYGRGAGVRGKSPIAGRFRRYIITHPNCHRARIPSWVFDGV